MLSTLAAVVADMNLLGNDGEINGRFRQVFRCFSEIVPPDPNLYRDFYRVLVHRFPLS
jgi:hypothetical protein